MTVDSIIGQRIRDGTCEYLVKWHGEESYSGLSQNPSWESSHTMAQQHPAALLRYKRICTKCVNAPCRCRRKIPLSLVLEASPADVSVKSQLSPCQRPIKAHHEVVPRAILDSFTNVATSYVVERSPSIKHAVPVSLDSPRALKLHGVEELEALFRDVTYSPAIHDSPTLPATLEKPLPKRPKRQRQKRWMKLFSCLSDCR